MNHPEHFIPWPATAVLTVLMALAAGVATAGESRLAGELDGETREWIIVERQTTSSAAFSELSSGLVRVTIAGHADDLVTTEGSLVITFMVMQGTPREVEVKYFPEASRLPVYTLSQSDALDLDSIEIDGDTARIVGGFDGDIPRQEDFNEDPDPENSIHLDVEFDVQARRQ